MGGSKEEEDFKGPDRPILSFHLGQRSRGNFIWGAELIFYNSGLSSLHKNSSVIGEKGIYFTAIEGWRGTGEVICREHRLNHEFYLSLIGPRKCFQLGFPKNFWQISPKISSDLILIAKVRLTHSRKQCISIVRQNELKFHKLSDE